MGLVSGSTSAVANTLSNFVTNIASLMTNAANNDMAQIMDPRPHVAERLYDQVASGQFQKALFNMEEPSVTPIGQLADTIFSGISKGISTFKSALKTMQTWRTYFETTSDNSECDSTFPYEISCFPMATGTFSMSGCKFTKRSFYEAHFTVEPVHENFDYMKSCINKYINPCKSNCFNACLGAGSEISIGSKNFTYSYSSNYFPRNWKVIFLAQEEVGDLSKSVGEYNAKKIIDNCESSERSYIDVCIVALIAFGTIVSAVGFTCLAAKKIKHFFTMSDTERIRRMRARSNEHMTAQEILRELRLEDDTIQRSISRNSE
ncbi:MAG TPA: hypothetical protein VIH61_04715, partial [Waddliaceae bacterium]